MPTMRGWNQQTNKGVNWRSKDVSKTQQQRLRPHAVSECDRFGSDGIVGLVSLGMSTKLQKVNLQRFEPRSKHKKSSQRTLI